MEFPKPSDIVTVSGNFVCVSIGLLLWFKNLFLPLKLIDCPLEMKNEAGWR